MLLIVVSAPPLHAREPLDCEETALSPWASEVSRLIEEWREVHVG